ncbi:MAG: hypothetical protein M1829_004636 [Trizodia sp. TS-e1964]|nr:MAG: hypothetical protein M1829_004636 [Trizodia sp. TS-e1964]
MMMFLWAICAVPTGVYAIVQNFNIPLQIQPQIFCTLALLAWAQILIYHCKWSTLKASIVTIATGIAFGTTEATLILTLRGVYNRGISYPMTIVGVIAAVLLAIGLLPPYFEIWKRNGRVVGINFTFLTIDFMGALFSLLALVAQEEFDILGGSTYIVCMALEIGLFSSHWIWLFRTRKVRKLAKLAGKSIEEFSVVNHSALEHAQSEPKKPETAFSWHPKSEDSHV